MCFKVYIYVLQGALRYLVFLKHTDIEVLLQVLVGEVDAELLETVVHKVLEAGDVQDADEARVAPTHQQLMAVSQRQRQRTDKQNRCVREM